VFLANTLAFPITRVSRLIDAIRNGDLRQRSEPAHGWHARELAELMAFDRPNVRIASKPWSPAPRTVVAIGDVTQDLMQRARHMMGDEHETTAWRRSNIRSIDAMSSASSRACQPCAGSDRWRRSPFRIASISRDTRVNGGSEGVRQETRQLLGRAPARRGQTPPTSGEPAPHAAARWLAAMSS